MNDADGINDQLPEISAMTLNENTGVYLMGPSVANETRHHVADEHAPAAVAKKTMFLAAVCGPVTPCPLPLLTANSEHRAPGVCDNLVGNGAFQMSRSA